MSKKITRVEVIDAKGRSYQNHKVDTVNLVAQDGGKTLKIFITETDKAWYEDKVKE